MVTYVTTPRSAKVHNQGEGTSRRLVSSSNSNEPRQGQAGSLYLPPPSSPEAESVVPPSSRLVPVARSGDSAGDGDQHHHGDPLGWLRDAIPGTASGHCTVSTCHQTSDVSKPTQSENPLQNVHLFTYRFLCPFCPRSISIGHCIAVWGHGGMWPVYR